MMIAQFVSCSGRQLSHASPLLTHEQFVQAAVCTNAPVETYETTCSKQV